MRERVKGHPARFRDESEVQGNLAVSVLDTTNIPVALLLILKLATYLIAADPLNTTHLYLTVNIVEILDNS